MSRWTLFPVPNLARLKLVYMSAMQVPHWRGRPLARPPCWQRRRQLGGRPDGVADPNPAGVDAHHIHPLMARRRHGPPDVMLRSHKHVTVLMTSALTYQSYINLCLFSSGVLFSLGQLKVRG